MTEAWRAAFKLWVALKDQTRTHYAPDPPAVQRGRGFMSSRDAMTRARNGKKTASRRRRRR